MASDRRKLDQAEGVTLEEVTLRGPGGAVARAYVVKTPSSPEVRNFESEHEARNHFRDEVNACRNAS